MVKYYNLARNDGHVDFQPFSQGKGLVHHPIERTVKLRKWLLLGTTMTGDRFDLYPFMVAEVTPS